MTLPEVGQALGWMGGVLFLIDLAERKIRAVYWQHRWAAEAKKRQEAPIPRPLGIQLPPVHTLTCTLCGEKIPTFLYGCTHADAPSHQHGDVVTALPSTIDPP